MVTEYLPNTKVGEEHMPRVLACGHSFCTTCLHSWWAANGTVPPGWNLGQVGSHSQRHGRWKTMSLLIKMQRSVC